MQSNSNPLEALASHNQKFPPLEHVTRSILTTEEAAHYLNRKSQTLRCWAMRGDPIAPVRINSRLGWKVAQITAKRRCLMNKFFEMPEAKNHELLIGQRLRIAETHSKVSQNVTKSTDATVSTNNALNEIERAFIHGKATAQKVDNARAEATAIADKLIADQRLLSLADAALQEIDLKISESLKHVKNARFNFCMDERNRIAQELNSDAALQKKLIDCFAAYRSNGLTYSDDWSAFIRGVLIAKPEQHLIDKAVETFHANHKLNRQ